jgi:hypothetical protein
MKLRVCALLRHVLHRFLQESSCKVRAVDAEDYEVFDMPLTGTVKARETARSHGHAIHQREGVQDGCALGN